MGLTIPSFDGLELPWRAGWPQRLLVDFPGALWCLGAAHRGVSLSSLLWCLVVNELLTRLNGGGVYTQGYADDICLLAVGKFPNTVSRLIQWALYTVETRCDKLGLSVNPDKTGLVAFTRRRKLLGFFEPCLFGMTLHCSMLVKYLKVILDSRVTWREHVDVKVRKAHNVLWACRSAYGVTWGLRPKVVCWIRLYHQATRHFFILGMVAWLSDGQCQEKTKQSPKTSMLRYNKIHEEESDVGWTTSNGHGGEVLVIPKDRLKN
jgi:hypothetical protein